MFDLTSRPLRLDAYSGRPFSLLDGEAQQDLATITAINLIENGDKIARQNWQNKQITNLLRHAHARSKFWRARMPSRLINHSILRQLPVLSREDIRQQVSLEGSLVATKANAPIETYASTGSTGTPVKVFVCHENGSYNSLRSLCQYFIYNLTLDENQINIAPPSSLAKVKSTSTIIQKSDHWAGTLGNVFRNGSYKSIVYSHDNQALFDAIKTEKVGYLVSPSRYVELLIENFGLDAVKALGIKLWIHVSDYRSPETLSKMDEMGIKSLSIYSAGETGPIAYECAKHSGYFHVAHTNVVVETDNPSATSFDEVSVGRLLITHLSSFATPLIRYDIGDFGHLEERCPCGHNGTTISHILGRGKHFLRHPDGRLLPFYVSTRTLLEVVQFKECRVRQKEIDTITVEIGGRDSISPSEENKLRELITKLTDPAFTIVIKAVDRIDWTESPKRLFFSSSVA